MTEVSRAVVVGYDGSGEARTALDWAALHAARERRGLLVLFASGGPGGGTPEIEGPARRKVVQGAADAIASAGVERAHVMAPGIAVRPHTSRQGAAAALQEVSEGATLVVVGDRHHRRMSSVPEGSVAFAVAAHAHGPVVLVPAGSEVTPGPQHPVVVGVDGSSGSDLATQWGADLAASTRADLMLASGWHAPQGDHWRRAYLVDDQWRHEDTERARHGAARHVAHARGLARRSHPDLMIREHVVEGRADTLLTNDSTRAAVVVVGARGQGDLATMLLGSVARGVMHRSHCPVAVIR